MKPTLLFFAFTLMLPCPIHSQTDYQWSGGNGNWSNPLNWSPNGVPGISDNVLIAAAGTYDVTLDVDAEIADITVGGSAGVQTLSAIGHSLTISGAGVVAGSGFLGLADATADGSGSLIVHGTLDMIRGILDLQVTIASDGLCHVWQGESISNGTLGIDGNLQVVGSWLAGPAFFTSTIPLTNDGVIDLSADHSGSAAGEATLAVLSGTLENNGTLNASGDAGPPLTYTQHLDAALANHGTVNVNNWPLHITMDGAVNTSDGTINVTGNDLTITQVGTSPQFTNSGTITIGSGRSLFIDNGNFLPVSGSGIIDNAGTIALTNNAALVLTDDFTNGPQARISLTDASCTGSFVLTNMGDLIVDNSSLAPELVNETSGFFQVQRGCAADGTIRNDGFIQIFGSWFSGSGFLTCAQQCTNNGILEFYGTQSGTVQGEGTLTVQNGSLENNGTLNANGDAGPPYLAAHHLDAALANHGTINLNNWPLRISKGGAVHTNDGTININGHDLTIDQSGTAPAFQNDGTLSVDSARTVFVTGGTMTNGPAGTVRGGGTLDVSAASFSNEGSMSPGDSVGVLTVNGGVPDGGTAVLNIDIAGPNARDELHVTGSVTLNGMLRVFLGGGFVPVIGDSFRVMTFPSATGSFGSVAGAGAGADFQWAAVVLGTEVFAKVIGITSVEQDGDPEASVPVSYMLGQNYPNPFNPSTTIRYGVPEASHVALTVFDIGGRQVTTLVDGYREPGYHRVVWNGRSDRGNPVASGVFFVRFVGYGGPGDEPTVLISRMILTK